MPVQYGRILCVLLAVVLLSKVAPGRAQGHSTLWTSWVPLAVRSPYLSCWMNTTNIPFNPTAARTPTDWPLFWNDAVRFLFVIC